MQRTFLLLWTCLLTLTASAYERLQGPTELLFHDKEKAFNSYTLFGVGGRTWLLDMEGRVVHTWPVGTNPHLLDNGHILDASKDDPSGFQGFKEVDWDGKTVWEWWFFDHVVQDIDPAKPHHVGAGKSIADYPGRININLQGRPLKRDWLHCNSLDYNAETGHLVINSVQGELYVVDHDGTFVCSDTEGHFFEVTAKGELAWKYINPENRAPQ
jgi:hypothetical protein